MTGDTEEGQILKGSSQRTPLFEARHFSRYARQELIRQYQGRFNCRLVVLVGELQPHSVSLFEETLFDADSNEELHTLLNTIGGDGEVALRLLRQAHSRSSRLTVAVPNIAKSAGTLFALGAHRILMGPMSDLGPTDPQLRRRDGATMAAKSIVAAVEYAIEAIAERPETLELHAVLLAELSALDVQAARDALNYADDLLVEAIACLPGRTREQAKAIAGELRTPLIGDPNDHGASISAERAIELELPVVNMDPSSEQWRMLWRLWARYFEMGDVEVYEGERASSIFRLTRE